MLYDGNGTGISVALLAVVLYAGTYKAKNKPALLDFDIV